MIELDASELGELLMALRTVQADIARKARSRAREGAWTDEQEAANPGFRQFLIEAGVRDQERLIRIGTLKVKLRREQRKQSRA